MLNAQKCLASKSLINELGALFYLNNIIILSYKYLLKNIKYSIILLRKKVMKMLERLKAIEEKYNELTSEISKPEVLSDIKKTLELSKEQASLKEAYDAYQKYKKIESDLEEAKEMTKDKELGEFAKEEINRLNQEKEQLEKQIEIILLPKDPMVKTLSLK